ncbi:hypothetical protein HMPREF9445_02057 [Bacteroides clarus YIT 12056]|uniref:Uncharacterized protein n=1 Tax=Bacteroides clarus YIT 12056 TaxID=762984 RepID=A0ABN0CM77_9BACE|nr:hypothetical protein HMPREF9445_02057 [Bacteroides clarus YIT 12056]
MISIMFHPISLMSKNERPKAFCSFKGYINNYFCFTFTED